MRKCKYYFMFFISLLICTGCESELSRKNMVYRDDRTETDFSEILELSDYIGLPQEEVIKTLNLVFLGGERDDRLSESAYRGSKENAYFFIHFRQGVMQDIWLPVTEDPPAGICSLAGCDMAMLLEEAAELFSDECQSTENDSICFSGLELEKKGILELELVRDGNGDLRTIAAEVSGEKLESCKGREYIWTDKTIAFSDGKKGVEIQIEIPQIEIPSDIILEGNLNRIFENGVRERLNQCGWNMDEMDRWENISIRISGKKTFESAEYISIRYTGSVVTDEGSHDLDFGTTCHTSDGGGMVELSQIFNDKIFDQYENSRTMYPVYAENEDAFADFLTKDRHCVDFYLKPSRLICLGTVRDGTVCRDVPGNEYAYDTVSLLREETVWNWDEFWYQNEDAGVSMFLCVPQVEVQLQEDQKRRINREIGKIITEQMQGYGLDFEKMEEWEETKIELGGVCTSLSKDYRQFLMKGEIIMGKEMYEMQFEFIISLKEN